MRLEKEAVAEMVDMVVKMAEKMTSQAIAAFECSLRSYQPSIRCLLQGSLASQRPHWTRSSNHLMSPLTVWLVANLVLQLETGFVLPLTTPAQLGLSPEPSLVPCWPRGINRSLLVQCYPSSSWQLLR